MSCAFAAVDHARDARLRVGRVGERHRGLGEAERPARRQRRAAGQRDEFSGHVHQARPEDEIEVEVAVLGLVAPIAAKIIVVLAAEVEHALRAIVVEETVRDAARARRARSGTASSCRADRRARDRSRARRASRIGGAGRSGRAGRSCRRGRSDGRRARAPSHAGRRASPGRENRAAHRGRGRRSFRPAAPSPCGSGRERRSRRKRARRQRHMRSAVAAISVGTAGHEQSSSRSRPAQSVSSSPWAGTAQVRFCRTLPPRRASPGRDRQRGRDDPHRGAVAAVERKAPKVEIGEAGVDDRFHRGALPGSAGRMLAAGPACVARGRQRAPEMQSKKGSCRHQ